MTEPKTTAVEPTEEELARRVQEQVGIFLGQVFFNPKTGRASVLLDKDASDQIAARWPYPLALQYAIIGRDSVAAGCAHQYHDQTKGKKQQGTQIITASSIPAGIAPPTGGKRGKGRR